MTAVTTSVTITHPIGLHARPAVKLTKLAKSFAAEIRLRGLPDGEWVDAKSIVKVMALKLRTVRCWRWKPRAKQRRRRWPRCNPWSSGTSMKPRSAAEQTLSRRARLARPRPGRARAPGCARANRRRDGRVGERREDSTRGCHRAGKGRAGRPDRRERCHGRRYPRVPARAAGGCRPGRGRVRGHRQRLRERRRPGVRRSASRSPPMRAPRTIISAPVPAISPICVTA